MEFFETDDFKKEFARRIRACRRASGYTMKEIAEKLNVSEGTVKSYEGGRTAMSCATIARLANFYDISADFLICFNKQPRRIRKEKES